MFKQHTSLRLRHYSLVVILLVLTACASSNPIPRVEQIESQPAPTVSSAFVSAAPTLPPLPTVIPFPSLASNEQRADNVIETQNITFIPVYNDTLASGWSLDHSLQMTYDLHNTSYVDKGRYSLYAQPGLGAGQLYFTLNAQSGKIYLRDQVLGLRFRLTGGSQDVTNDALLVTVVGSNAKPYWIANDTSVKLDGRIIDNPSQPNAPLFSETRLYYLGINGTIPAKTWVDVILWLDEREFDPIYTYVTGFYLKTDRELLPSFYIDEVSLMIMTS